MVYDPEQIYKDIIELIENDEEIVFFEDVIANIPCNSDTFYRYYPTGSEKYVTIKSLLSKNKISIKKKLRKKLFDSEKDTGIIALYKLVGNKEDREKLSGSSIDHKSGDGSMSPQTTIDLSNLTAEELLAIIDKDNKGS